MLVGIFGYLGSGKTLLLTALMNYLQYVSIVVTNYYTTFSDHIMNAEEMILRIAEFEPIDSKTHRVFGIDELGTILKALDFYSDENEMLTDIARKSRKLDTDIYYTTQSLMMVDRNIRRITDVLIHVTYNVEMQLVNLQPYSFDGLNIIPDEPLILQKTSHYFDLYDTNEVIEADKTAVLKFFVKKCESDEGLQDTLSTLSKPQDIIETISFYSKCSKTLAKQIYFKLYKSKSK